MRYPKQEFLVMFRLSLRSLFARCGSALALTGLLLASSAPIHSQGHDSENPRERVAKLFANACSNCHLPPDPDLPTDRAWLNQIKDTA